MTAAATRREGWTKLNISMHWLIVLLIIVQYVDHDWMEGLWRGTRRGTEISSAVFAGGWLHIVVGTIVLAAAAVRLWDRYARGRPQHPQGEPNWAMWLAKITHFLLYAILLAMPVAGLIAWFAGNHEMGDIHSFMWTPLLILIAVHVLGAFVQQFWFKTNVLKRIVVPA